MGTEGIEIKTGQQPEVAAGQVWHYLDRGQTLQYTIDSVGPDGVRATCGALLNAGFLREMGTCIRPAPTVAAVREHATQADAKGAQPANEAFLERDLGDTDFVHRSQAAFVDGLAEAFGQQIPPSEDIDILDIFGEAANDEAHPYHLLVHVMLAAFAQAALGKGKERHASGGTPFHEQPMATINRQLGSVDGFIYQAHKKSLEAKRLPDGRAQAELLGSINYLAGAVIALDTWAKKDAS